MLVIALLIVFACATGGSFFHVFHSCHSPAVPLCGHCVCSDRASAHCEAAVDWSDVDTDALFTGTIYLAASDECMVDGKKITFKKIS
jgi:hypothetical protein